MTEHDYHADYIFEKTAKEDVASSSLFSSLLAQNPSLRQVIERMLFYIDQTKNNENTNEYKFLLSLFKSIDNARLLIAQPAPAAEKGIDGPSSENATH